MKSVSQQYVDYINNHCGNVVRGYQWLMEHLPEVVEDEENSLRCVYEHDNSKWSSEEFDAYARYFYEPDLTEEEKAYAEVQFDIAWNHHQKMNPHHWQYWVLKRDTGEDVALDMPDCYIIEMICDWWAFSWAEHSLYEIFKWYDTHKEDMILSESTRNKVENILTQMEKKLEELE